MWISGVRHRVTEHSVDSLRIVVGDTITGSGGPDEEIDFAIRRRQRENALSGGEILEQLTGDAEIVGHGQQQIISFGGAGKRFLLREEAELLHAALAVCEQMRFGFRDAADEPGFNARADLLRQAIQRFQVVGGGRGPVGGPGVGDYDLAFLVEHGLGVLE